MPHAIRTSEHANQSCRACRKADGLAFDLPTSDGKDLRTEPLTDRKHELRRLLSRVPASRMLYVEHVEQHGTALFQRSARWTWNASWQSTALDRILRSRRKRRGSRFGIRIIRRWWVEKNCSNGNDTRSPHPAGTLASSRAWRRTMPNCQIECNGAGTPCDKPAVAKCSDCGMTICSGCRLECCGDSFCEPSYDYHVTHSCLRRPVQNERDSLPTFRSTRAG